MTHWSGLLIFAGAYLLAVLSPGPGVAALIARGLSRGTRGVMPFVAGFVIGDLVWFAVAYAGMAVLAQTFAWLLVLIKWCGVAYLSWLALRLWLAPAEGLTVAAADAQAERGWRVFLGSLSLTLGNPKPIVFFMALLPTLVDMTQLHWAGALEIAALIVVIMTCVAGGYSLLAARARRYVTSARHVRLVHRTCGLALAGAAIAVARQ
ncbi:MAG: LysE family translocator [Betaproteobacteria bacterium]|nr:LysE family translocator [Betaproteobacteria bacterium]